MATYDASQIKLAGSNDILNIKVGTSGIEDGAVTGQKLAADSEFFARYQPIADNFFEIDTTFERGDINNGQVISRINRIVTSNIIEYDEPSVIKVFDSGFRFGITVYDDNDTVVSNLYWINQRMYIPAGTRFRMVIARATDVTETADITLFRSKVLRMSDASFYKDGITAWYDEKILDRHLKDQISWMYYKDADGKFVFGGHRAIPIPQKFPFDVTITNNDSELYYFNVKTWLSDQAIAANYISTTGWVSDAYTIQKDTWFTVQYAPKNPSVTPQPPIGDMDGLIDFSATTAVQSLLFWNTVPTSYSDHIKNVLAHDMEHKYLSNGRVVPAPKFYAHVANKTLPIGVTVSFDDARFKVAIYTHDGDVNGSYDSGWDTNPKYIPANTFFMISAQYETVLTYEEWYEKFTVIADDSVTTFSNFTIPDLNYGSTWHDPRFQLLWFSDIHADRQRLRRIVAYANANSNKINDVICTGDMVAQQMSDGYDFWSEDGADDILVTIGNHDGNAGNWQWADMATIDATYFEPYVDGWGATYDSNSCSWYKVYNNNIMLIGVNAVYQDSQGLQSIVSFLNNSLGIAIQNGYSVIVAHHYPVLPSLTESLETPFETPDYTYNDMIIPSEVIGAVDAFKNDGGEFVCYITGHTHADLARKMISSGDIILTIGSARVTAGMQSGTSFRDFKTKDQDLFNILTVDTVKKIVSVKRIGSNRDMWFRKIDSLAINYDTGNVLPQ